MAQKVINGAIGTSPAISKLNQQLSNIAGSEASEQMEQLVCKKCRFNFRAASMQFDACRRAVREQMKHRAGTNQEGSK